MVPNRWKKTNFGKHIDLLSGYAFKSADYSENPNDIKLLRGDNIEPNKLRWKNVKRWPRDEYESLEKYHLKEGDFIVAMDRTWVSAGLKVAEVTQEDLPCLLVQRVSRIRALPTLHQSLIKYYFSSYNFEYYVKSVQTETAVPHISSKQIKDFGLLLPPLSEQQKIAKILTTWDKAISTTERLIDNSKQQKKALMQQLLTGKKRLLDDNGERFEGKWEDSKLSDLYSFKRGKGISKGQITDSGNKCVLYGELYTYYGEVIRDIKSRTLETNSVKSKQGDVLIPASTTTTGIDLANATAVLEDDILLGGDINILRPKKSINPIFMAHLLTHFKKHEIARKAQGITIIHVYGRDLANIAVQTPSSLEEQQKIAAVLTNADKEIELLEQQLADLKQEKKALMQVLLTGKKRVRIDG